jgi:hypothetical protein
MFNPMGDTGFTGKLISPPDPIPNPVTYNRGSMHGLKDNLEPII